MAKSIFIAQSTGTFYSANNVKYLDMVYELNTPYTAENGAKVDLKNVIDIGEVMSVSYQGQKESGVINVMSNFPLLVLASAAGLNNDYMCDIDGTVQVVTDGETPKTVIKKIQFRVPLFGMDGRQMSAGDNIQITLNLSKGKLTAYNIDNPNTSTTAPAYKYRQKKVLAGNEEEIPNVADLLYVPNSDTELGLLQLGGTNISQWTKRDVLTYIADTWVSNLTPVASNYIIGFRASAFNNKKIQAGTSDLVYYYTEVM